MVSSLAPCPSCSRHVKTSEGRCPFCRGALSEAFAGTAVPGPTQRLSRAAAFAFTASLAVTGCGSQIVTVPAPAKDAGAGDGAALDSGASSPAYGGSVPIDAGYDAADTALEPDAGPQDSGGGNAIYGAPALPHEPFVVPVAD